MGDLRHGRRLPRLPLLTAGGPPGHHIPGPGKIIRVRSDPDGAPSMTGSTPPSRTKDSYDAVAGDYAERFSDELGHKPLDRAMLSAFAEQVREAGSRRVVDVGCGPGHVTAHLRGLGLEASGVDLSPAMVAVASDAFPDLRFVVGDMTSLDESDDSIGGLVAFYSIIHIPTVGLADLFREFHRVLIPGGYLLLAFQAGEGRRSLSEWFGHRVSLEAFLRSPEQVAALLEEAGLSVAARLLRPPIPEHETAERAYVLARKPSQVNQSGGGTTSL
jgi:SAM-dependent methyltransferase